MKKNKINIGIVGTGFGGFTHIPAFQFSDNCQVLALYGRNKTKTSNLAKKYDIKYSFDDYESMLKLDEIDLISIALPPFLQYKYVDLAIDYGKHILCEKPFTLNSSEAKKLNKKIKKTSLLGAVGYQMRFQPGRKVIKNILKGGDLGEIIHVNMSYDYSSRLNENLFWDWWSSKNSGGGVLNALGSHQIDLLRWWFGDPIKIDGDLDTFNKTLFDPESKLDKKVTSDELVFAKMKFDKNINISLSVSSVALGWKTTSLQIYGSNGALFLDGEENISLIRKSTAQHDLTQKEDLLSEPWISGSIWRAAFYRQVNALISSILNKSEYRGATFHDGLITREIMDKILIQNK